MKLFSLTALALVFAFSCHDSSCAAQEAEERRRPRQHHAVNDDRRQRREKRRQSKSEYKTNFGNGGNDGSSENDYSEVLNSVFPLRRPRGLLEGSLNAFQSAITGALLSTVSVLGGSILGFMQGGILGVLVGGIIGSVAGFAVLIGSAFSALYHLVFGIVAAPKAFEAAFTGKIWDDDEREWILYSLQKENEELDGRRATTSSPSKFTDLYQTLGVNQNATRQEIKKAYRRKARTVHPDKNPNDENAQAEFLKLFEAYSTLSDDKQRSEYDRFGTTQSDQIKSFDAKVFFAVFLDADLVEPFVGQLRVSFYVSKFQEIVGLLQQNDNSIGQDTLSLFMQGWKDDARRRYVEIANHLVAFVEDFENGAITNEEFTVKCEEEAKKIQASAFGNRFLSMIGKSFIREVNQYLGYSSPVSLPMGMFASTLQFWDRNRGRFDMANKTYVILNEMQELQPEKDGTAPSLSELDGETIQKILPNFVDLAWTFIASDISWALHGACKRVFQDVVSRKRRRQRAKGLRLLGIAMLSVQDDTCLADEQLSAENFNIRLQTAFNLATMNAN